ncbi:type IV toxin-antitoxin system AbiEi family antitoxin domain-containing protein [Solirubrobacter taibaiensis]|nr:type IV toxin-antitoxin system AbiEi family antitoxin domain-containing protein [Solirubrobacter taibaiensis]
MTPDCDTPMGISAIAARQHGVVTIAQLRAHVSETTVRRWVAAGRLHRVHRGVYAVGHPGLSRHGRWSAAVLAAGDNAALSHLSVAEFWNVSRWPTSLTSVVSTARRALTGVELHTARTLDPRDVLIHNGIRVTTVARMLVDLTDVLTPHQLAYVIHEADFRRIFDERAVRAAMARANGRRNLHRLQRALELRAQGSAGTRSAKEDAFLEQQAVEPLVNTKIEVDFHWPDEGRVVEIDGHGHDRLATQLDDVRRDEHLTADGWTVERIVSR